MTVFNEVTLQEQIHTVWGEHGAHADVYAEVLKRAYAYEELAEVAREVIRAANRTPEDDPEGRWRSGWPEAMSKMTVLVFPMEIVKEEEPK